MKLSYANTNRRITAELEGDSPKDLFSQLSKFQEVFDQCYCGKCKSENIRFVERVVEDNAFYELRCSDCYAKLAFGSNKKGGGLFPKRKDAEGKWLDNNGWTTWSPVPDKV